ncbi:hypothetical protein SVAN01_03411 [Stagonosporopsis vannaccii]|nr:hypothetical protein SVAN01_03411 [Stagonosporopsis vannaccii]
MNTHADTYQPDMPTQQQPPREYARQEYEVTHHENRGPNQVLTTRIGSFPTLELAQHAAQEALNTAWKDCSLRGFCGYYFALIDLQHRGLVIGLDGHGQYFALSEIRIKFRETIAKPAEYQPYGTRNMIGVDAGYHNIVNAPVRADHHAAYRNNNLSTAAGLRSFVHPQVGNKPVICIGETFSQTRLPWPNRSSPFIPRTSYDETMILSPRSNHHTVGHGGGRRVEEAVKEAVEETVHGYHGPPALRHTSAPGPGRARELNTNRPSTIILLSVHQPPTAHDANHQPPSNLPSSSKDKSVTLSALLFFIHHLSHIPALTYIQTTLPPPNQPTNETMLSAATVFSLVSLAAAAALPPTSHDLCNGAVYRCSPSLSSIEVCSPVLGWRMQAQCGGATCREEQGVPHCHDL